MTLGIVGGDFTRAELEEMKLMLVYMDEIRHWTDDDWLYTWRTLKITSPWRVDQDELILCDLGVSHRLSSVEAMIVSAWHNARAYE